jgi:cholesterol transport system auxiliary component
MKTSPIHSRLAANMSGMFLLGCVCGLTGCLSRPALNEQTFTFSAPAIAATNIPASDRVLGIRNLQIAAPFEGRSLVYRTGEFSYVRDPYAEFMESPAEELMAPVRAWLRGNGDFSAVVEAGSAHKPDTLVEISVSQLFGDFRQPEHPAAILTIRFVFFDAPNGVPGKVILEQEYSRSIPLNRPTAAALMEGWNRALTEILTEVSSDLARKREQR